MNDKLLKHARNLAKRPYQALIFRDEYDGGEPTYFVRTPELPGCVSHGDTVPEALEWIELARVDYIYFLLEDGLSVPDPQPLGGHIRINMSEYVGDIGLEAQNSGMPRAAILPTLRVAG